MATFPDVLKGEGIELRRTKPTFELAKVVYDIVDRNREYLSRWLPWAARVRSPEDEFNGMMGVYKNEHAYFIFADGQLVGSVSFVEIKEDARWLEIGYWIDQVASGKGIITQAVKMLEAMAFGGEYGDWNLIRIRCDALNDKSAAIPKRLGYLFEGTIRQDYLYHNGEITDTMNFSKLKSEWNA